MSVGSFYKFKRKSEVFHYFDKSQRHTFYWHILCIGFRMTHFFFVFFLWFIFQKLIGLPLPSGTLLFF